ncbi:MAG: Nramp family divalent metal transporter [Acidobacteriota bacterium]|nr:Nramp family divalent metal transporter [Acidobacteriota bacterium]
MTNDSNQRRDNPPAPDNPGEGAASDPTGFVPPHPGSRKMPRWNPGELIDAPRFVRKHWYAFLGPGLVAGAGAIGGGEWLLGPLVTARYGGALLWLATLSILAQGLYNIEISRYTLYTGEPIFTGKFRTAPGPRFWLAVYLILDFGSVFPYLAATAATPVMILLLGGQMPDPDAVPLHWWMHKLTATGIFAASVIPLIFGGKVYNSLKAVMSFKLVTVFGFLLIVALLYSSPSTWVDIGSGFFKFGTVPVMSGEDRNGNGRLDPGEDWDGDGHLDVVERRLEPSVDSDGDGRPDTWERGPQGQLVKHEDLDGDGFLDGPNVENVFVSWFGKGVLPTIDFTLIAFIAAMAAIAGNGGLSNTPISNFTRDQGWGMGHHVGAIPSMVGGQGITLSHVGSVFEVNRQSLPRWQRWYRHVVRDQCAIWIPACFIGLALPSMLSVEFLRRGTEADRWNAAALTAEGVGRQAANPPEGVLASMTGLSEILGGTAWGNLFWASTLFCGFMVLAPTMVGHIDGVVRRWLDTIWTSSSRLRQVDPARIGRIYFGLIMGYSALGLAMLWLNAPTALIKFATISYNFALGISCCHTLILNTVLLPRELRPGWFVRIAMALGGLFFFLLGLAATLRELGQI